MFPYGDVTCATINSKQRAPVGQSPTIMAMASTSQITRPNGRKVLLTYPEGDSVRFGEVGVGLDDVVLADGHGVDLDLIGDALGVAELGVESKGSRWPRGKEERREAALRASLLRGSRRVAIAPRG
jgi:hypothetical protein